MKFVVATHEGPHGLLIVVTDAELMGTKCSEGKLQLDLTGEFYQGEAKGREETEQMMKSARILHLTGEDAINLGLKLGFILEKRILRIQGVPHAEAVLE